MIRNLSVGCQLPLNSSGNFGIESSHVWAAFTDQGTRDGTALWTGAVSLFVTVLIFLSCHDASCHTNNDHRTVRMVTGGSFHVWADHQAPRMSRHLTRPRHEADAVALAPYFTDEETGSNRQRQECPRGARSVFKAQVHVTTKPELQP